MTATTLVWREEPPLMTLASVPARAPGTCWRGTTQCPACSSCNPPQRAPVVIRENPVRSRVGIGVDLGNYRSAILRSVCLTRAAGPGKASASSVGAPACVLDEKEQSAAVLPDSG